MHGASGAGAGCHLHTRDHACFDQRATRSKGFGGRVDPRRYVGRLRTVHSSCERDARDRRLLTGFCRNSRLAVVGSALSIAATRNARDQVGQTGLGKASSDHAWKRQARLLTLGYVGHTWELFGTCSTFACGLQSSGGRNCSLLPCPSLTALMMIGTSIRNGSKGN